MALQFRKRVQLAKVGWRKALAMGLAGASMMGAPMKSHAAGSEEQWDQLLNKTWSELGPKQQQELRQEERAWIKWKDQLPADERYWALEDHLQYLNTYKEKGLAAAREELKQTQDERAYNRQRNKRMDQLWGSKMNEPQTSQLNQDDSERGLKWGEAWAQQHKVSKNAVVADVGLKGIADEVMQNNLRPDDITSVRSFEAGFAKAIHTAEDISTEVSSQPIPGTPEPKATPDPAWKARTEQARARSEQAKGTKAYAKGFAIGKQWAKDNDVPDRNERQAFWDETLNTYLPMREVTDSELQAGANYATGFTDAVFGESEPSATPTPGATPRTGATISPDLPVYRGASFWELPEKTMGAMPVRIQFPFEAEPGSSSAGACAPWSIVEYWIKDTLDSLNKGGSGITLGEVQYGRPLQRGDTIFYPTRIWLVFYNARRGAIDLAFSQDTFGVWRSQYLESIPSANESPARGRSVELGRQR